MNKSVDWDYSALAAHYDNRADYCADTLARVIGLMSLRPGDRVADIGAGTGKLSLPLARTGLAVNAVEPNAAMRSFGIRNGHGLDITWSEGTGEQTGLSDASVRAAFFGSSFNVVDRPRALAECRRIVAPQGWFCCLWNHRDLEDPLQAAIEAAIHRMVPNYSYGSRRADPTSDLEASGLFDAIHPFEGRFVATMRRDHVIDAWRSHATLERQAGPLFTEVVATIAAILPEAETVEVPYETRLWAAKFST